METLQILTLVLSFVAPLLIAPVVVWGLRRLFAMFLREAASLFVGLDMHDEWAIDIGTTVAVFNTVTFVLAWWAAVIFQLLEFPPLAAAAPFFVAMAGCFVATSLFLRARLGLAPMDGWMVGLLTVAGGNLPLIIAVPALLVFVS